MRLPRFPWAPLLGLLTGWAVSCPSLTTHGAAGDTTLPTHVETDPIRVDLGPHGKLKTMAMDHQGHLLLGVSHVPEALAKSPPASSNNRLADPWEPVRVYSLKKVKQDGKVLATWSMKGGLQPSMIYGAEDGTVYVAGNGRMTRFQSDGTLLASIDTDALYEGRPYASGLCVGGGHVFLAFGLGNSLRATEDIFRFDLNLKNGKQIISRQYGCCAHIDMEVHEGKLLVAENSRHRVNVFDLDGNPQGRWGQRDRVSLEGFAACCNPCNTDFGPDGILYTAESGVGRVKKYSASGEFLGLVGYVDTTKFDQGSRLAAQSCYIPVEVSEDASRIFVMDVRTHFIRVLARP